MNAFLFFIFLSLLHPNDINLKTFEAGRRGDLYRVWVYFDKKDSIKIVNLDDASIKRRIKHNLLAPTKYDYLITTLRLHLAAGTLTPENLLEINNLLG